MALPRASLSLITEIGRLVIRSVFLIDLAIIPICECSLCIFYNDFLSLPFEDQSTDRLKELIDLVICVGLTTREFDLSCGVAVESQGKIIIFRFL